MGSATAIAKEVLNRAILATVVFSILIPVPALAVDASSSVSQASNDDSEPNDDFSTATPIDGSVELGDLYIANGESDYFSLELDEGEALTVSIDFSHARGDLDLTVFGPERTVLGDSISVTDGETVSITATQSGTYYVRVYGFAGASAPYSLQTSVSDGGGDGSERPGDQFEPNDEFDSATPVSAGSYDGLRIQNGESDFFAVDLEAGQELTAAIEFSHTTGDLDLQLLDPDRNSLESSISVSDGERASITADRAGTYFVMVYGYSGASAPYSLEVTISDTPGSEGPSQPSDGPENDHHEPNDVVSSATAISPGTQSDLQIVNGESDYFAIELDDGQELTATLDFSHSTGDLDLAVLDPDQNVIASSVSVTDTEAASITADRAGTYYLRVYGYGGASAPYSLDVAVTGGPGDISIPEEGLDLSLHEPYNVSTTAVAHDRHDFVFEISFEPNRNYHGDQSTDPHNLAGPINISTAPDDGVWVNVYRKSSPNVGGEIFGEVAIGTVSVATGGTAGIAVEIVSTGSDIAQAIDDVQRHGERRTAEHYSLRPDSDVFRPHDPPNVTYLVHVHSEAPVDEWRCDLDSGQFNISYNYYVPIPDEVEGYEEFTASECVQPGG